MIQLCLANDSGVDLFKQTLQSTAHDEHMRYIDGSKNTMRDLKAMSDNGRGMHTNGKLIYLGVEGNSGLGLEAGNLGLNDYDVAVGFSRGQDSQAARAFSEMVISRLKQHWAVKIVPDGSGALPNAECAQ